MHHSSLGAHAWSPELLGLVGELADPARREEAAAGIARLLGGERLLFFAPDPELGVLLPAPGFSQVLRGSSQWRTFLDACIRQGQCSGWVPGSDGHPTPVSGCAVPDGVAAVLMGGAPEAGLAGLRPLLPLLGALFHAERRAAADQVRVRSAADALERSRMLTQALQEMRERLEAALGEAQEARGESRRRAEQAESLAVTLREQASQLQALNDQLVARSAEAERARMAADVANRAKSEFLAIMSHELRTPINAVVGYAELLTLGVSGPVTEAQQGYLERIRTSSMHLLSLVNDVLDLAKVEAGRMAVEHEPEPVADVVTEAIQLTEREAANRGISVINRCADSEATYVGDRDRVRQVLVNLLSNAVKFSERGSMVTLRCVVADRPEDDAEVPGPGPWTCLLVEDTGIGIGADELHRVFQPFVQVETGPTRTRGGTGLGLTISRQLAGLMGGALTVRSHKNQGSTFCLWLPAEEAAHGAIDPAIRVSASGEPQASPEELTAVGERMQVELAEIIAAFARRLRADPELAEAPALEDSELLEQVPVLVADLATLLIKLGRSGGDQGLLWRGSEVQRLIAEKHGVGRAARGWDARALQREFVLLGEELARVVRETAERRGGDGGAVDRVLAELLQKAEYASLRSLRAAAVAAAGTSEPD